MSRPDEDALPRARRTGVAFNVAVTALDVVVALIAFQVTRALGGDEATAYLVGCVGPLLGSLAVWLRAREWSGASIAVLAFTLLSALAALLGTRNAQALLYKDAIVTGIVGLVFLGSLLARRPLAYYFGQRYLTDSTHEGMERWARLWPHAEFRRANIWISVVWGAVYVLEVVAKALIIRSSRFDEAYWWSQVLPFAAAGTAIVLTFLIVRHYRD